MRNVLIPTDLTHCTLNTMKYAISLCSKSKTKMFFYNASEFVSEDELHAQTMVSDAFKKINYFPDESLFDIIIEKTSFSNERIKIIIEQNNIELVIMGTSPKGQGLTFFESHVSEFINEVTCPVLSIPHDYHELKIDRIGYATELFDLSKRIKEIIPFARMVGAYVEAFHVYPVFPEIIDVEKFDVKGTLSKLSKANHYNKINLHFIKTPHDNKPVSGIREFLRTYKPDMLVMCHKPRGLFDKLVLDSGATNAMVRTSPIPILALNQKTASKIM